jgi:hypothetical protein
VQLLPDSACLLTVLTVLTENNAGRQVYPAEALELPHRPGRGAVPLVQVQLHDLVGVPVPGVGDGDRGGQALVDVVAVDGLWA